MMCKESLPQYQQELSAANLTDFSGIKRLNYYVSQFSLTTVSNEIGVKIASAAHHSPSHPLFDEIYVYISVFSGPPLVQWWLYTRYWQRKWANIFLYGHNLSVILSISFNITRCTTVKMLTWEFTGCGPLLTWNHLESLTDWNIKNDRIISPAELIVKCLTVNFWM